MTSEIQCITSFIDIDRGNWSNNYKRSNDKYINNFIEFYSNIELDLIVFCSDFIKNEIIKKVDSNFRTKINFQIIDKTDLEYFNMVDTIKNIQNSDKIKEYKRRDPSNPPEYSNPEYVALMFAKTEFIKIAYERELIFSDNIAWIDFGIGHGDPRYIEEIKNKKLISPNSDKIILFNRQNIQPSKDPFFYSKMLDNVLVCGGFYIIPTNLIIHFYNEFKRIVNEFIEFEIIDDDQTILSILAASNDDKCNVISSVKYKDNPTSGDWFPVFEFIKEKKIKNMNDFFELKMYERTTTLCEIMNLNGSDKGNGHHNYTRFYDFIFNKIKDDVKYVFELGLGTNNLNIPSNMSGQGNPCGSLRGWRDYFKNAEIYGADIDKDILVQENRIKTYFCDQTNTSIIDDLSNNFNFKFDIIIEDGLHTFSANIVFFENFIKNLKIGGFFIIEDVHCDDFDKFEEYISLNKSKYNFMQIIKIPNESNKSDNNVVLIIK